MCGRFTLAKDARELAAAFPQLPPPPRLARRYNIAPARPRAEPAFFLVRIQAIVFGDAAAWSLGFVKKLIYQRLKMD